MEPWADRAKRALIHSVIVTSAPSLTCLLSPAASAWVQVHHLDHMSVSPCHRTLWWCDLLCLWGNNCTEEIVRRGKTELESILKQQQNPNQPKIWFCCRCWRPEWIGLHQVSSFSPALTSKFNGLDGSSIAGTGGHSEGSHQFLSVCVQHQDLQQRRIMKKIYCN